MNTSFFKRLLGFGQETNFKKYKNDTELLVKNRLRRSLGLPEFGAGASRSSVAARFFIASLVGLMVVLPAARAFAAAYVTLDSFSGNPTTLHASGGGWASGETVSIYLGSTAGSPAASASADAGGSFGPASVVVPPSTPEGALPIIAIGSEKGQRADNSYYVVHFSASVTAESSLNTPGSSVGVSGSGFAPGETVSLSINGVGGDGLRRMPQAHLQGYLLPSPASQAVRISCTGLAWAVALTACTIFTLADFTRARSLLPTICFPENSCLSQAAVSLPERV